MKIYLFLLVVCFGYFNNSTAQVKPDAGNAGLKLPAGFAALKAADGIGSARHLAIAPTGDIFVKLADKKTGKEFYGCTMATKMVKLIKCLVLEIFQAPACI